MEVEEMRMESEPARARRFPASSIHWLSTSRLPMLRERSRSLGGEKQIFQSPSRMKMNHLHLHDHLHLHAGRRLIEEESRSEPPAVDAPRFTWVASMFMHAALRATPRKLTFAPPGPKPPSRRSRSSLRAPCAPLRIDLSVSTVWNSMWQLTG